MDIKLHSQKEILNQDGWLADVGSQILSRFDKEQERLFPCLFARKAFAQNMVKFLPVPYLQSTQNDDFNALTQG